VGGNRGLGGDRSVAHRHADDGGHVGFGAEDVNGDAGGLP